MFEELFKVGSDAAFWKEQATRTQELLDRALEARKDLLRELSTAINQNREYEKEISELEELLSKTIEDWSEQEDISQALADENRDLVRQLELYKAVLTQLRIPVKLPARKQ